MTRCYHVAGLGMVMGCLVAGCSGKVTSFGQPLTISAFNQVEVDRVLAAPEGYDGKTIRLAGTIDSVCSHRGCWVRLGEGDKTVFVKFTCPVEGRLVPMEAKGHRAMVEGTFECKEVPESEARHYLEDRGASAEEIAKIQGPQKEFFLKSEGIMIEGLPDTTAGA